MNPNEIREYYSMLRTIPLEERIRQGLGDEYLAECENTEMQMVKDLRKEGE